MKAGFMKTAAVLFSAVLACSVTQFPSLAEKNDDQPIMFEKTLTASSENQLIIPGKKNPGSSFVRTGSNISLKSGNYANWIDRVDLPDHVLDIYNQFVEGSDNDGEDDFLILGDGAEKTWDGLSFTVTGADVNEVFDKMDTEFDTLSDQIQAAYNAFDRDHPEVFWLDGVIRMQTNGSIPIKPFSGGYKAEVPLLLHFGVQSEYQTYASIHTGITMRDSYVHLIMLDAPDTAYEKVQYFNSWLTENNGYNAVVAGLASGSAPKSAWECISALKGSRGTAGPVCEGYARAFKVLCDEAGIDCTLVDGYASSDSNPGEAHMWNYVKLDDKWYAVDVTWDDPIVNGADTTGNEDYLLVGADTRIGQKTFIASHPVTNQVSPKGVQFTNGPVLNSGKYAGHTHTSEVIPAVPATCTEDGLTEGSKCPGCGEILTAQTVVKALGHAYKKEVTKPICTEEGYTTYTCNRCNDCYVDDKVSAAGHKYAEGICTVCGTKDPNYVKPDDPDPVKNPFTDISKNEYFYNPVLWAYKNGVTGGTSATTFGPNDTCTRAQVVTFLWKAYGSPEPVSKSCSFADVSKDAYYYKPVLWAVEKGITSGINSTTFGSNDPCTRAQVVCFLWSAAGKTDPSLATHNFKDVSNDAYYYRPVLWALEHKITSGISPDAFGSDTACTRGQVVTFLYTAVGE